MNHRAANRHQVRRSYCCCSSVSARGGETFLCFKLSQQRLLSTELAEENIQCSVFDFSSWLVESSKLSGGQQIPIFKLILVMALPE